MGFFRGGGFDRSQNFGGGGSSTPAMAAVTAAMTAVKYETRSSVAMNDATLMYKEMRCRVAMNEIQIMNAAVELVTLHQSGIIHRDTTPHFRFSPHRTARVSSKFRAALVVVGVII